MTTALRSYSVQDEYERPVPGASIYVYNPDGSLAALTSDGTTVIANPLTTGAFGNYSYYALAGFYREDVWFGGIKRWSENNVAVGGPSVPSAPYNLLPNTQWEIWSGVGTAARWKADGSGLMTTASLVANTTSSSVVNLTLNAVPAEWKVGHLVKISGYTGGLYLGDWPMPILALTDSTHIQVRVPLNLTPTLTGTGTVTNQNVGGSASAGTGDAADYWKKPTATQAWREDDASNLTPGATYAMGLQKNTAGQETVYSALDVSRFAGRQIVFGAWVKHQHKTSSGTYRLSITTNLGSTYSGSGSVIGAYQYFEVTALIPANATSAQVGVDLLGASGDIYYFANPMLAFGGYLGSNGYTKPREELIPIVKLEPPTWINAAFGFPADAGHSSVTFGYGFPFDLYSNSGAQIARSVRLVEGSIEGINTNAVVTGTSGSRLIGWTDGNVDPIRLGNFMSQQVANVKCHQQLRIPLVNGTGHVFSGVASDGWGNVSVDLDLFHLE